MNQPLSVVLICSWYYHYVILPVNRNIQCSKARYLVCVKEYYEIHSQGLVQYRYTVMISFLMVNTESVQINHLTVMQKKRENKVSNISEGKY